MKEQRRVYLQEQTTGDAAVDGLLAGVGAGIICVIYLVIVGLISGQTLAGVLGPFDPTQGQALAGGLVHLAVSGVYGVLFAVLYRWLDRGWLWARGRAWFFGLLYGLILLLVAEGALQTGIDTAFADVPFVNTALFHLLYGLALGLFLGWKRLAGVTQ
jgi:hypothetical protein